MFGKKQKTDACLEVSWSGSTSQKGMSKKLLKVAECRLLQRILPCYQVKNTRENQSQLLGPFRESSDKDLEHNSMNQTPHSGYVTLCYFNHCHH
jgi:hypothetical protein